MRAKLYWFRLSHPSQAVRKMLELKGIPYDLAGILPGNQRIHLRLAGFRDGTVPAIKLDGRRVQGSVAIARALEELQPEPPLYPADPERRRAADETERWGDDELQNLPRQILRWGLVQHNFLRDWLARDASLPAPGVVARISGLNARYYAHLVDADAEQARRNAESLPSALDRIDGLLADGTLTPEAPTAVTYQVLCTVRALSGFEDFQDLVAAHPSGEAAVKLFPEPFSDTPAPAFVPREWLSA